MKVKKIGMRTIKTVIAVVLTLEISKYLNINSPILAGIAAIMTMETSVSESFSAGKFRMFGTVLGALIAIILLSVSPANFITTAIGLVVIIYICNLLNWQDAVKMAMIVFLVIIVEYEEGYRVLYALNRTIDTFIGVIVGTTINYFIRPPKIDIKIHSIVENIYIKVMDYIEELVWGMGEIELNKFKIEIDYIQENYETLKEDLKFKVSIDQNLIYYEDVFELVQNIHSHLRVIKLIDRKIYIDKRNKKLLEEMFQKDIPKIEYQEKEEIDIIYNYHLRKVISDLKQVKDWLETEV